MNRKDRRRHAVQNGGWMPWQVTQTVARTEAEMIQIAGNIGKPLDFVRDTLDAVTYDGGLLKKNNIYQVAIRGTEVPAGWPAMTHLAINRHDFAALGTEHYRDLQRIKQTLLSAKCDAVEVYPAESRLNDCVNQYHLWCLDDSAVRFPLPVHPVHARAPGNRSLLNGYVVEVTSFTEPGSTEEWPGVTRIDLRRPDGRPLGAEYFPDLQGIKNAVVGRECEAVEIYPADGAPNPDGWHTLWAMPSPTHRFPFGFDARLVVEQGHGSKVQQAFN